MRWITSAGGPLVLVPEMMVAQWQGVRNGGGDYTAASEIEDYIGVIKWRGVDVLVLNDEPLATTYLTGGITAFLRWMYAPNEDAIKSVIQDMEGRFSKPQSGVMLVFQANKYVLFDAGAPGDSSSEMIEVGVVRGSYVVETHIWKPSEDIGLVVHVLKPSDDLVSSC